MIKKFSSKKTSKYLIYASIGAIVLSALGYLGMDIWLASTQWLLVALVLGVFGLYLKK